MIIYTQLFDQIFLLVLGVEKNNDDSKRHYFSSNHHEAPAEIIRSDARLEMLVSGTDGHPSCERRKRPYTKHDDDYWNGGGIQEVRRNKIRCTD